MLTHRLYLLTRPPSSLFPNWRGYLAVSALRADSANSNSNSNSNSNAWSPFGSTTLPGRKSCCAIEGTYKVLGIFYKVENNIGIMKAMQVNSEERHQLGELEMDNNYDENKPPVSAEHII